MNLKSTDMCKEVTVVYFKVLSHWLPERNEKGHEKSQLR
jgi:hypothetical protein